MRYGPSKNPVETPMKLKFIEGVIMGMTKTQAAARAGSKNPKRFIEKMRECKWVQGRLEEHAADNRKSLGMTREKVQKIVTDAVEIAQLTADPAAMIRGAAELNKMCGFYAPEETKVTIEGTVRRIQTEYEHMSEEDLLRAIGEEQDPIEAEFELLEASDDASDDIEDAEFVEVSR